MFVFLWQVWLLRVVQSTTTHQTEPNCYAQPLSMHEHSLGHVLSTQLAIPAYGYLDLIVSCTVHAKFGFGHVMLTEQSLRVHKLLKSRAHQGLLFYVQATPTADTAMFYFQTNALGFTPEFLGRVRLAGSLASLAGVSCSPHSVLEQHLCAVSLA